MKRVDHHQYAIYKYVTLQNKGNHNRYVSNVGPKRNLKDHKFIEVKGKYVLLGCNNSTGLSDFLCTGGSDLLESEVQRVLKHH